MINRPRKQASLSVVANWHKSPIFLHSRVYDFSIARPSVSHSRSARSVGPSPAAEAAMGNAQEESARLGRAKNYFHWS